MPQRRDNAGDVCDSSIGMLFVNTLFLRNFCWGGGQKIKFNLSPELGIVELSLPYFYLFELAIEFNFSPECGIVEKSSIFVVQKADAPKIGLEFHQGSIGTIRSSLATSYDA